MQFSLQLPPANVPAPCAIHAARPQCLGCKAARRCRVAPPPAASTQDDPADESSQLQDNLVSMLRLEIGKKEVSRPCVLMESQGHWLAVAAAVAGHRLACTAGVD